MSSVDQYLGNPVALNPAKDGNGELIPHVYTFNSIFNSVAKVYSYRWDEAVRHNPENALAMRRDCYIRSLLQERSVPTVNREWNIKGDNPNDPVQKATASHLKMIVKKTPKFKRMLKYLLEAMWFGRYGSQITWKQSKVLGINRWVIGKHKPVNGDKIQGAWDDTPAIFINPLQKSNFPAESVVTGDRNPMLKLNKRKWRDQFIIHTHEVEDADYFEGEMAGAVQGFGLRTMVYWAWWLRDEMLSWAVDFMKKVGTMGLLIFPYEMSNPASKEKAEENAKKASQSVAMTMPIYVDNLRGGGQAMQPIHIPASAYGIEALQHMIAEYFEKHMERLIIGQSMSSGGGGAGGLEGDGRAEFAKDTKFQLLHFDADNLAETLTTDLVEVLMRMNFPQYDFPMRFEFVIPDPAAGEKLQAAQTIVSMGGEVKLDQVMEFAGLETPGPDDETIGGMMHTAAVNGELKYLNQGVPQTGSAGDPQRQPDPMEDATPDKSSDDERDPFSGDDSDLSADDDAALERAWGNGPTKYAQDESPVLYQFNPGEWQQTKSGNWHNTRSKEYISAEEYAMRSRVHQLTPQPQPQAGGGLLPNVSGGMEAAQPQQTKVPEDWKHIGQSRRGHDKWMHGEHGGVRYGAKPKERDEQARAADQKLRQERLARPASTMAVGFGTNNQTEIDEKAKALVETVFPDGAITHENVHEMFGSLPGMSATVMPLGTGDGKFMVRLNHPDVDQWSRHISVGMDGQVSVYNAMFFLKPRARGNGLGTKAFTEQVRSCAQLGVSKITTTAGKGGSQGDKMNGFYTWARLGYDADLDDSVKKRLPKELKGAKTVQDLMATPEGREHWKKHGNMTSMTFDLSPGSKSISILNNYLREKGQPPIEVDAKKVKAIQNQRQEVAAKLGQKRLQERQQRDIDDTHRRMGEKIDKGGHFNPQEVRAAVEKRIGEEKDPSKIENAYHAVLNEMRSTPEYEKKLTDRIGSFHGDAMNANGIPSDHQQKVHERAKRLYEEMMGDRKADPSRYGSASPADVMHDAYYRAHQDLDTQSMVGKGKKQEEKPVNDAEEPLKLASDTFPDLYKKPEPAGPPSHPFGPHSNLGSESEKQAKMEGMNPGHVHQLAKHYHETTGMHPTAAYRAAIDNFRLGKQHTATTVKYKPGMEPPAKPAAKPAAAAPPAKPAGKNAPPTPQQVTGKAKPPADGGIASPKSSAPTPTPQAAKPAGQANDWKPTRSGKGEYSPSTGRWRPIGKHKPTGQSAEDHGKQAAQHGSERNVHTKNFLDVMRGLRHDPEFVQAAGKHKHLSAMLRGEKVDHSNLHDLRDEVEKLHRWHKGDGKAMVGKLRESADKMVDSHERAAEAKFHQGNAPAQQKPEAGGIFDPANKPAEVANIDEVNKPKQQPEREPGWDDEPEEEKAKGPSHVDQANELLQQHMDMIRSTHNDDVNEHNEIVKHAEELVARNWLKEPHKHIHPAMLRRRLNEGKIEQASDVPGLDKLADELASQFPHRFRGQSQDGSDSVDHSEALFDILKTGKRKRMSREEAEEKALEMIADLHHSKHGDKEAPEVAPKGKQEDEEIPFRAVEVIDFYNLDFSKRNK